MKNNSHSFKVLLKKVKVASSKIFGKDKFQKACNGHSVDFHINDFGKDEQQF